MNYLVTSQLARGEEKLIASFDSEDEVLLFISKKLNIDEEEGKKVIYRLYGEYELLQVWNIDNISISSAMYADGNADIDNLPPGVFEVMINFVDPLQRIPIAQFYAKSDALLFIVSAFEDENDRHANDVFFIFKGNLLMHTVNKSILEKQKRGAGGASGQENGSKYQISPLSTRPTPGGGPPDYWVEKDDADE